MRKGRRKKKMTFSKVWVGIILGVSIFDVQLAYVCALLGKPVPETMTVAIITEIVAVSLGYFIKSFKETKEEESIKYLRDSNDIPKNGEID